MRWTIRKTVHEAVEEMIQDVHADAISKVRTLIAARLVEATGQKHCCNGYRQALQDMSRAIEGIKP